MIIKSLGHACYTASDGKNTVIFDPFLEGNPDAVLGPDEVQATAILPSHGHSDHLGDAIPIAIRLGVPIIAPYELAMYCQRHGAEVLPLHIDGGIELPWGYVKLTDATHGSAVIGDQMIEYTGPACGFLVTMSGQTVYFAGDTGLFGDMKPSLTPVGAVFRACRRSFHTWPGAVGAESFPRPTLRLSASTP